MTVSGNHVLLGPQPPHPRPSRKFQSTLAIEAHLERVHEMCIDAINARDFDPANEVWRHHADEIKVRIEVPPFLVERKKCTLADHIKGLEGYISQLPELRVECISQSTTVEEAAGRGKITHLCKFTGNRTGIVSISAGTTKYRLIDDRWLITAVYILQGVNQFCVDGVMDY